MFWKKHKPKSRVETPDPTPVAMPVNFHRPKPLQEQMREYTRRTLNHLAEQQGAESFEEADDFDIGDETPEPASPHELEFGSEGEARFERLAAQHIKKFEKEWNEHHSKKSSSPKGKKNAAGSGVNEPAEQADNASLDAEA